MVILDGEIMKCRVVESDESGGTLKKEDESCPCALTEHHAMKAYWGSGGITPCILDLGTR
jgi:hypothetical protein